MRKIGFLINPIAGMGGKVALKGTDGEDILQKAIKLGATPVALNKAVSFFRAIKTYSTHKKIIFVIPQGKMGDAIFKNEKDLSQGFRLEVILNVKIPNKTTKNDTLAIVEELIKRKVELILFVGGDGTAQDVYSITGSKFPMMGLPSGVKIHSGVFAQSVEKGVEIINKFVQNSVSFIDAEIIDLDESDFRNDILNTRLFGTALVPQLPSLMQLTKTISQEFDSEEENIKGIIKFLREELHSETLYFIGSGTTIKRISVVFGENVGKKKSLLGIDAVLNNKMIRKDISENIILELIDIYSEIPTKLILTPIGGQGFILGRGNQQISPSVIKKIGIDSILIISTKLKINSLTNSTLHVDTGDSKLDQEFKGFHKVLVDYREYRMMKIV
ncbi:MAG: ATP-NAD kinase family protein [Candidatus Hodarchaeales archaeon]|jgi:predicted polyphosphate/ATP-dependent NAD kinase